MDTGHTDSSRSILWPVFVSLEGPEGAGKSTVAQTLVAGLRSKGHEVVLTREPGEGDVGSRIRQILLEGEGITSRCELFLFLADRAQHVETVIKPALAEGKVVVCDRYADSTVVYQGYGRGIQVEALRKWNDFATSGLSPDVTLLLDLSPAIGLERLRTKDRLDREPLDFHERVRNGFLQEAARDAKRWVVINADQNPADVAAQCLQTILNRF